MRERERERERGGEEGVEERSGGASAGRRLAGVSLFMGLGVTVTK